MKDLRRKIAVIVIMTVMVCSFNINGIAAPSQDDGWVLNENNDWLYKKNGEFVENKMLTINKITYFFKEGGAMASDETLKMYDIIDDQDVEMTLYAFLDGKIAKNRWIRLNDEGHLVQNSQEGDWYYFDENGARVENRWLTIKERRYAFDEEGRMLSEVFVEDGGKYYFEHDGQMAKGKWLNVDDDWYSFKSDGSCKKASDSDATYKFDDEGALISETIPCPEIDSIALKGSSSRNAEINKTINVTFDVEIASDSNAREKKLTKNHDFWIEESRETENSDTYSRTVEYDYDNGTCTIEYEALMPDTVKLKVVIDGIESAPVTITSDWGQNAVDEKAKALETLLSISIHKVTDVSAAIRSVKSLCENAGASSEIKKSLLEGRNNLNSLDSSYAMINRNLIATDNSNAAHLLGNGDLKLIGGSLNAGLGDKIKLIAAVGDAVELPEAYEKQVSVELNFYVNDTETSELAVPVIVSMPIPKGMKADGLKVFHAGANGTPELLESVVEGNEVFMVTDSFSDFIFAGSAESSGSGNGNGIGNGGGGSGRSSSSSVSRIPETPGAWKQMDNGKWQFVQSNGAPYLNTWAYVKGYWYWLDAAGMMTEGWQDINGNRYYLMPGNGNMVLGWLQSGTSWYYFDETGAMKTGWVSVNAKWYYLNLDGTMLSDTVTPDGFKVDLTGARIN